MKVPYEEIAAKIMQETGISEDELNEKVEDKLNQLSGLISKEGAAHIIANELGVKLLDQQAPSKVCVNKLSAGMRSVTILLKAQKIFEARNFEVGPRKGKVQSIVAGDETGTTRVVLWNDQTDKIQNLKEGDIILLENAYVKENNNQKEVHLNDRAKLEINPVGQTIGEIKQNARARKKIETLQENEANVELLGTIVQSFEPRFYEICPFCSKRTRATAGQEFVCEEHGKITPKFGFVLNAILDDGTGTIRTVFFKNQAENLTGKSEEEILAMKDNTEKIEQMKTDLLGEIVKIVGRVSKNDMFNRLEFVSQLVFRNPNPDEEIKAIEQ